MVIYCHGSLYFPTDVSLFISFSFLHLDCVSQRTCPNLLMASEVMDFFFSFLNSCWMFGRWLFRWIKTTLACHSLVCAAANLLWSHCAAIWIKWESKGKKRLLLHFMLRTASLLGAVKKRNVQYWSVMGWNWHSYKGKINSGYFRCQSFLISLNRCDLPQFSIVCVASLSDDVSGDVL